MAAEDTEADEDEGLDNAEDNAEDVVAGVAVDEDGGETIRSATTMRTRRNNPWKINIM